MSVELRELRVDGAPAWYRTAGAGPVVVVVPGLGLTSRIYAENCRQLARAGFRAIAPDLPGFGRTPGPQLGLRVEETAAWLGAFARELGIAHAAWIGHSLSCQHLLTLAARAPELVRALVLIAPTGAPGEHRLLRQLTRFALNAFREPPATVASVLRDYFRSSPVRFFATWLKSFEHRPHAHMRAIRARTLIVAGARDPVIPRAYLQQLAQQLPAARIVHVPRAAHGAPFDRRDAVNAEVIGFLRGL